MFILNLNSSVSSIIVPSPVTSSVLPIVCAVQTNMPEEGGGQENDVTDNTEKGDFARVSFELLFVFKSILKEISWFSDLLAYYEQSRYESHPGILYKFAFANQEGCSLTRVVPSDHFNVAYDVWGCNNK